MPKINSFKITPIKVNAGRHAKLAPKILTETIEIDIDKISAAQANAIRRVISNELPVKVLLIDRQDIESDDPYVFPDLLIDRVRSIPVMQTIKEGTEYELVVKNDSATYIDVIVDDFTPNLPANGNIIIMHLDAGRYIKFRATVTTVMGYGTESMPHVGMLACQCVSVPGRKDLKMYDQYVPVSTEGDPYEADAVRGVRSGVNRETRYVVRFCSLGIMPAKEIFRLACETLIARLQKLTKIPITSTTGEHLLHIDDESATIGPIMIEAALAVDFSCNMVYDPSTASRAIDLRFRIGELEPAELIKAAVDHLVKFYRELMAEV